MPFERGIVFVFVPAAHFGVLTGKSDRGKDEQRSEPTSVIKSHRRIRLRSHRHTDGDGLSNRRTRLRSHRRTDGDRSNRHTWKEGGKKHLDAF